MRLPCQIHGCKAGEGEWHVCNCTRTREECWRDAPNTMYQTLNVRMQGLNTYGPDRLQRHGSLLRDRVIALC